MDTRTSPFRLRIEQVQEALTRHGLAAVLVPSSDPHLSEYLPERWQGRQWLSGFTGSMGTLVVTRDRAAVFADSRYWVQAEAELAGTGIELVRIPTGNATHHVEWLAGHVRPGETVGVDGRRARPGGGAVPAQLARGRRREAAHRLRRARRRLARAARPAGRAGVRTPRAARAARAQRQARGRCARRWPGTARPTTSSRPSTTSPGCSTCAART